MQLIEEYTSVSFILFITWPIPCSPQIRHSCEFFWAHGHSTVRLLGMLYLPVASQATCMLAKDDTYGLGQETFNPYPLKDTHDKKCSMMYVA